MAVGPKVEYKLVAQSHQYLTSQSVLTASPTVIVWLGLCIKGEWFIHLTVVLGIAVLIWRRKMQKQQASSIFLLNCKKTVVWKYFSCACQDQYILSWVSYIADTYRQSEIHPPPLCTFSTFFKHCSPHISAPYSIIGCICTSEILEKKNLGDFPAST